MNQSIKSKLAQMLCTTALVLGCSSSAHAQLIVSDPLALVEQAVTAVSSAKSLIENIQMVRQQVNQIQQAAKHLENIDLNSLQGIRNALGGVENLLNGVLSTARAWENLSNNWEDFYSTDFFYGKGHDESVKKWSDITESAIRQSVALGAQAIQTQDSLATEADVLDTMGGAASGTLQIGQVQAQMLNVMIKQQQIANTQAADNDQWQKLEAMERRKKARAAQKRQKILLGSDLRHKQAVPAVTYQDF